MNEDRAKTFLQMIHRSQRGRLKVYLGYGPGVGKTYMMLQEAHRLKKDGIDVVVGIVETHGRSETAKVLEGLELIPRRTAEYHGITIDEMDIDAVLTRRPQVVLVDELAHTNIPGSRNSKRYEDVQELLFAGIHVVTSLNIQHLESLYNTVEQLLGVKVRERIPDSVLADADDIVNVDLTAEDLQQRLQEGKIYPKDRIASSLENFFKVGNLEHLRELTMREIASQIDFKRRDVLDEGDKIAPDQIMVCMASKGPNSARLLRAASRLAGRLNRNWYAVYVQTPSEDPTMIDVTTQRLLADTLTLANQLGATVFTFKGRDVVQTILNFAREYRVGHIVIGRPNAIPEWKRRLFGKRSVAEELVIRAEGVSIVVVDAAGQAQLQSVADVTSEEVTRYHDKQSKAAPLVGELLESQQVLICDEPIRKDKIIEKLVYLICLKHPELSPAPILDLLKLREDKGSTFLNEGIALPHVTVKGLKKAALALALTKGGISDVKSERPIEAVFLLLDPAAPLASQAKLMSRVMKIIRTLHAQRELAEVHTGEQLLELIRNVEATWH
ncbi:MAG: PTS sugar transporter subunit IIA [Chitinophagaceae bacterium]|nr:PTS sugar transporter subunit IIA [Oligoflexus sp.]